MERPRALRWAPSPRAERGAQWCWGRLRGRMPTVAKPSLKGRLAMGLSGVAAWRAGRAVCPLLHIHTHRPGLVRGRGRWEGLLRMRDAHSRVAAEPQPAAILPGATKVLWTSITRKGQHGPSRHPYPPLSYRAALLI